MSISFLNVLFLMAPPSGGGEQNPFVQLIPLILIFVIFYFFLIRPQQKKQKDREKVLESIKKGDKVVTIGGIHGTIVGIDTEKKTVLVQVSDTLKLKFEKSAVSTVEKNEAGEKLQAND